MDPTGEIVGFIIAGAIIGAYIGGSIAEGTMNPGAWAWDNNTWKGIAIGGVAGAATGALVGTMWAAGATVTIGGQLGANTVPLVSFSKAGFSTANTVAGLIGGAGATGVAAASINWSAVDFARQQEIEQNQSRSKRGTVTVDPLIYNGFDSGTETSVYIN